jgi:hypothetical protein
LHLGDTTLHVDWTLTVGDLLTVFGFIATAMVLYFQLDKQIAVLFLKVEMVEEDVSEIKQDTRQLKIIARNGGS